MRSWEHPLAKPGENCLASNGRPVEAGRLAVPAVWVSIDPRPTGGGDLPHRACRRFRQVEPVT